MDDHEAAGNPDLPPTKSNDPDREESAPNSTSKPAPVMPSSKGTELKESASNAPHDDHVSSPSDSDNTKPPVQDFFVNMNNFHQYASSVTWGGIHLASDDEVKGIETWYIVT